jgi:multiple sugar transport system ATP-binding protein
MASELVLQAINKIYNPLGKHPVHAVKAFDLSVKPGEIVALLGSSGCGKTSTLRMIAGFEDVTSGTISLDGKPIHTLPPAARGVAMAFEAYSLYPPLTIGENIAFALKARKLSSGETSRRVQDIAGMLEITDILGKYPTSVSGGQQQRASLGRALVRKASLTLLDEPMGQLEPQLRALLRGRIKHYLRENALTSILVTHDQTEANALADRIAVMEGGELQQYATPQELKERPANLFTGTFIGEPPMNVLPVTVKMEGRTIRFELESKNHVLSFPAEAFAKQLCDELSKRESVVLGVRPHGLQLAKAGLPAQVISCQWLGDQTHVASEIAGRTVVSVSHERLSLKTSAPVALAIAPHDLHIFDPVSGRAIAHGGRIA